MKAHAIHDLPNDMLTAALSAQSMGLTLLLAEMRALSEVMPGVMAGKPLVSAHVEATEEADFDNMPV